jgi:HSP20 family protein
MATTAVPAEPSAPVATHDIWRSFRSEMNWPVDNFTSRFGVTPSFPTRLDTSFSRPSPAVDVTDKDSAFVVSAEMPGVTEDDIQVLLSGDMLTIKGQKRREREEKGENRYVSERSYGEFQRVFSLPDGVDRENIAASFDNGVLTVTLPKSAKTAPQKIEIKAAA